MKARNTSAESAQEKLPTVGSVKKLFLGKNDY